MSYRKYPLTKIDSKNVDEDEPTRPPTEEALPKVEGRRHKVITIYLDKEDTLGENMSDRTTPDTS